MLVCVYVGGNADDINGMVDCLVMVPVVYLVVVSVGKLAVPGTVRNVGTFFVPSFSTLFSTRV